MKVLITGGAGFIGSHVSDVLLQAGHAVRVLDNLDPQVHGEKQDWPAYLNPDAERYKADVRDHDAVAKGLRGCDAVIHLAAAVGVGQSMYEIERYSSVNVIGTAVLLEEVVKQKEQVRKVIVASSMSIYGEGLYETMTGERVAPSPRSTEQLGKGQWEILGDAGSLLKPLPTHENKPLHPESVYAVNKRGQEEMCLSVGRAYGVPAVAMRMFNVYGPRQALSNPYTGVAAIFSARLLNGEPPLVFEDGNQRRDFVHIEDVACAYLKVLESSNADFMALNVGSGRSVSILEIAQVLAEVMGVEIEPTVTGKYRDGDIRHCFADISLIQETLGWTPKWDFSQGIKTLVEWLKTQQADDRVSEAMEALKKKGLMK